MFGIKHNNEVVDKLAETQKQCTDDVWALAAYKLSGEVDTYHLAQTEAREAITKLDAESSEIRKRLSDISRELSVLGKTSTTVAFVQVRRKRENTKTTIP